MPSLNYIIILAIGIIKLKIPDLASVGGRICFDERLPLALFRTKACDVWKYLEQKNKANQDTLNKIPRLSAIEIPKNPKEAKKRCKTEMDTTRVRLCFQVRSNMYRSIMYLGKL